MTRLKDFAPALKHIADIIERGIREHPELSVGMQTEGIEVKASTIERKIDKQTERDREKQKEAKRTEFHLERKQKHENLK